MTLALVHGLASLMSYAMYAHEGHAKTENKKVRKWDGETPYGVHPTWCGVTILAEVKLDREVRIRGAKVLLLHDIIEDTTAGLPWGIEEDVHAGVREMTFESFEGEMVEVWSRSEETRLFKLYDKVSNLLDGAWMSRGKRRIYEAHTLKLARDVERNYGRLNIVRIARAIARKPKRSATRR